MTAKNRAGSVIATILVIVIVVASGLFYFSQTGQFSPAKNGATLSDQRDATVSNDVANHKAVKLP